VLFCEQVGVFAVELKQRWVSETFVNAYNYCIGHKQESLSVLYRRVYFAANETTFEKRGVIDFGVQDPDFLAPISEALAFFYD